MGIGQSVNYSLPARTGNKIALEAIFSRSAGGFLDPPSICEKCNGCFLGGEAPEASCYHTYSSISRLNKENLFNSTPTFGVVTFSGVICYFHVDLCG